MSPKRRYSEWLILSPFNEIEIQNKSYGCVFWQKKVKKQKRQKARKVIFCLRIYPRMPAVRLIMLKSRSDFFRLQMFSTGKLMDQFILHFHRSGADEGGEAFGLVSEFLGNFPADCESYFLLPNLC